MKNCAHRASGAGAARYNAAGKITTESGHVTYVAFSPDGKQLLTKADDNSARLWDVAPASVFDALSFPQLLEEARKRAPHP